MVTVRNINSALGGDNTFISAVKRWFACFKGDTDFEYKPRSGCPYAVEDFAVLEVVIEIWRLAPAVLRRD